jgi:hypothetical protein
MTDQQQQEMVKRMLRESGYQGDGTLSSDDPGPLLPHFSFQVTMDIKDYINRPGAGAFSIEDPLFGYTSIAALAATAHERIPQEAVACTNGNTRETYIYTLKDMKLLAQPEAKEIEEADLHYQSSYELQDGMLHVSRTLQDKTKGNQCSPDYMARQQKVALEILADLKQQVVYQ